MGRADKNVRISVSFSLKWLWMPFPSRMISSTPYFLAWYLICFSSFTSMDRGSPPVSGFSGPTHAMASQIVSDMYIASPSLVSCLGLRLNWSIPEMSIGHFAMSVFLCFCLFVLLCFCESVLLCFCVLVVLCFCVPVFRC